MNRFLQSCMLIATVVAVIAAPAAVYAQPAPVNEVVVTTPPAPSPLSLSALGAGLVAIGAGFGIGKIGAAAMDGISRQPEAAKDIGSNMILAAALVEGAAIIALGVCFLK